MVIAKNPEPHSEDFQFLLNKTIETLEVESKKQQKEYLNFLGNKLENVVADIMISAAKDTPFENTIELISGQRLPDIIANKFYGVEVKTTKQNHWTTTGNSVLEGTRVDSIERIFMLFGKMISPIEFKCRPYEECLSKIVVTHSPRYLIDMDLKNGETIFDKLSIPYDTLRKESNPIKSIIEYYRQFLKPGEEVWWLDQDESKSTDLIIKLWNNLSIETRSKLRLKSMVLFPGIFSNHPDKFNELAVWLVNLEGIVCPNVRDIFTAGGQGTIEWNKKQFTGIPKIIIKMLDSLPVIKAILDDTNKEILVEYWKKEFEDKKTTWINLVNDYSKHFKLPFNLKDYLTESI